MLPCLRLPIHCSIAKLRPSTPRESRGPPNRVVAHSSTSNSEDELHHQGPTCSSTRTLLVAVDESAASKRAGIFALDHIYRPGGEHFVDFFFSFPKKIDESLGKRLATLTTTSCPLPPPLLQTAKDVVHLLHVVPRVRSPAAPSGALYYAPPLSCPDEAKDALEKGARAFISREFASLIADRALPADALAVDVVHELAGSSAGESVGDAIIRTAEELDAAALVMLSHEKKKLEQFIWGSVSKEVASRTKRPVVLVH